MRPGDLAAEPEPEPRRLDTARAAGEGVDSGSNSRSVVDDVDDDPAVALAHRDLDARPVPQPVGDQVREHLAQTCRITVHERCAGDGDPDALAPERRCERTEVDALPAKRDELAVAQDPLDVARSRKGEKEQSPPLGRRDRRRRRGERGERRNGAPQLVGDDLQVLAVDSRVRGPWLQPRPPSSRDRSATGASARRAAARTAGSGSST